MQSSNASSNWDFTAVIDFLHTPTRPALDSEAQQEDATPPNHHEVVIKDSPVPCTREDDNSKNGSGIQTLGDLTPLWDFLHPSTLTTSTIEKNVSATSDTKVRKAASSRASPPSASKPISIMKCKIKANMSRNDDVVSHTISSGVISDSTAGESDGDVSVFDSVVPPKSALTLIPPQVSRGELTPPSSCEEDSTLLSFSPKKHGKSTKDIIRYRSAVERKAGLVSKLSKQFPDFSIQQPSFVLAEDSSAVHVFVDASNISIGLHDSYKIQHGIPVSTHIKRLPLSFHNFSLILERGRPVAKKVLAGSDRFPAINEAEKLGYEVNILTRVHKAKEFTPRQLKFRNALTPGGSSETGSSSERWVEQCVDEILHLKMLESLVDTDKPATIVLATGDAAEAEYSGGFLRMVERALQKGWSVELVSFAMNTSFAYKRKEFRAKWGARFRTINLEDYVEEMLDM